MAADVPPETFEVFMAYAFGVTSNCNQPWLGGGRGFGTGLSSIGSITGPLLAFSGGVFGPITGTSWEIGPFGSTAGCGFCNGAGILNELLAERTCCATTYGFHGEICRVGGSAGCEFIGDEEPNLPTERSCDAAEFFRRGDWIRGRWNAE